MKRKIAEAVIRYRIFVLAFVAVTTVFMFWSALGTKTGSGYYRLLPYKHPITTTFLKHLEEFGGGNNILIAVTAKKGTIYDADYLKTLKAITDECYYLKGIDRSHIQSLFTPNTTYVEVVEGGFNGGRVVPQGFDGSPETIKTLSENVEKAGIVGRLVSNDYTSSMVMLDVQDMDIATRQPYEPKEVYDDIQQKIRHKYESDTISIEIIGFDMAVGEITEGIEGVLGFLGLAVVLITLLTRWFLGNWRLTFFAVICSLVGVCWNLGIVNALGYKLDILSILLPFLIFAIGMSHSIQILNRIAIEWEQELPAKEAAVETLNIMMVPALVALGTDLLGAIAIVFIPIHSVQELRAFTSIGVLSLMATNVFVLPCLASFIGPSERRRQRMCRIRALRNMYWSRLSIFATKPFAIATTTITAILLSVSAYYGAGVQVGDLHEGVPELKPTSRYNLDSAFITRHYAGGSDLFVTFVEGHDYSCIDYNFIKYVDELGWAIANDPNVISIASMPEVMKLLASSWGEGHPKWMALRPETEALKVTASLIPASTGLLNRTCSVIPIIAFLKDHKAESMRSVIATVNDFTAKHPPEGFTVSLASGNAGVMAAVNDTVEAAQYPLLIFLYMSVTILTYLLFRSWRVTACILIPLSCVSVFAYALLNLLEIGLKTSTLPVAALGTGLGIDYGIYIFAIMLPAFKAGKTIREAYAETLASTGSAVCFIGLTLSIAVGTWIFSDLKYQSDMGIVFSSMLILNMFGALFALPGLAYFFFGERRSEDTG